MFISSARLIIVSGTTVLSASMKFYLNERQSRRETVQDLYNTQLTDLGNSGRRTRCIENMRLRREITQVNCGVVSSVETYKETCCNFFCHRNDNDTDDDGPFCNADLFEVGGPE
jgi:hypothetical protein